MTSFNMIGPFKVTGDSEAKDFSVFDNWQFPPINCQGVEALFRSFKVDLEFFTFVCVEM